MDTNFLEKASRLQGRSAMDPRDPGAPSGRTTLIAGYQGIDTPGATGPAVRLGPNLARRLETRALSTCWPPMRH